MKNPIQRILGKVKREYLHHLNRTRIQAISQQIPDPSMDGSQEAPIIVFNASTRLEGTSLNAGFSLVTSWALREAGYPVVHFVCQRGMSRCVLGTDRTNVQKEPPCAQCTRTSRFVYQHCQTRPFTYDPDTAIADKLQGLSLDELLQFTFESVPLGELILPSMRWILRRHHLANNENNRQLAREYILSAENIMRAFTQMLDEVQPQAVIVFNGMFYPEAVARYQAKQRGIPVFTHEVGMLPLSTFFTSGEATAYPIDIPDTFQLSSQQEEELDAYLENRRVGKFSTAGVEFWPEIQKLDGKMRSTLDAFQAIVPVFTNVVFDTSQVHANVLFEHMFKWLDMVLESMRSHPEVLFIIRAHPDELRPGKESRETVADWVQEKHVLDLPNVRFINAREFVSSYELIEAAKFVMVYNSTIGLEASIMGKPVLCAGKARYTQVPTVFFPSDKEKFNNMLEEFLQADKIDVPAHFITNARKVLYSQLFLASLPFAPYLEDEQHWKGYVTIRDFNVDLLKAENSSTIRTILKGIQTKEQFLRES